MLAERPLLNRERELGIYGTLAYCLARTLGTMPILVIEPVISVLITSFMCLTVRTPTLVAQLVLITVIGSLAGESLGAFIGSLVKTTPIGILVGTVIPVAEWLVIDSDLIQSAWLHHVSITNQVLRGSLVALYSVPQTYVCDSTTFISECQNSTYVDQSSMLAYYSPPLSYTSEVFVLLGFSIFYRTLAYVALRFLHVDSAVTDKID